MTQVITVLEYKLKVVTAWLLIQRRDHQWDLLRAEYCQLVIFEIFDNYLGVDTDGKQEREVFTALLAELLPRLVLDLVEGHPEAVAVADDALRHQAETRAHLLLDPQLLLEFPA